MRARTHLAGGLAFSALSIKLGLVATVLTASPHGFVLGALFGSLLPDIDHPRSKFGRAIPMVARPMNAIFAHRGAYHSLLGLTGTLVFFYFAARYFSIGSFPALGFGISVGFLSHLVLDSLTPRGIHWLHPWKRFKLRGPIRTMSFLEDVVFMFFLFLSVYMFWSYRAIFL